MTPRVLPDRVADLAVPLPQEDRGMLGTKQLSLVAGDDGRVFLSAQHYSTAPRQPGALVVALDWAAQKWPGSGRLHGAEEIAAGDDDTPIA